MRKVPFVKASACGNDFLIIEAHNVPNDRPAFTRTICDRHNGIGADGVEWISPAPGADVAIRLINADGSDAEISGNGTRCVAAYWTAKHGKTEVAIDTGAGRKLCCLTRRADPEFEFETAMGAPEVGKPATVSTAAGKFDGIPVSMGNPHFVIFTESFPADWQSRALAIQQSGAFEHGVNVEFVRIISREHIEIRIFERGAGETLSSGTGSCASAVAAIATGRASSPVRVQAPGGSQTVRWKNKEVFLEGPARIICEGEFLGEAYV